MANNQIGQNSIITKKLDKWNRVETLLEQDEEKIEKEFSRQFPNESNEAFTARKKYFVETFINITHDLVSAPVNSIFRQAIKAEFEDDNSMLKTFSENVTLGNDKTPYDRYIKDFIGIGLRAYGNVITVIDKPRTNQSNRMDERKEGMPYLSNVRPQDVLDWQMEQGEMLWFAYQRTHQPEWLDPISTDKPDAETLQYIWTRSELIVLDSEGDKRPDLGFVHGWGFVPIVWQASFLAKPNDLVGNAAMDQTSNMILTMNNLYNLGVHELYKHGGSLLLMPEEAVSATNVSVEKDGTPIVKRQDNNGMFTYEGEQEPKYLVKELAVEEIMNWASFYKKSAVENERDLKSVIKKGMDGGDIQESSIAKVVDREPLEANLVALADDIEVYTDKVFFMVAKIVAQKDDHKLEIDKDFDIRTLMQKWEEIEKARSNGLPKRSPTLYSEMLKNTVGDVTRDVKVQEKALKEIDDTEDLEESEEEMIANLALDRENEPFKNKPNEGDNKE